MKNVSLVGMIFMLSSILSAAGFQQPSDLKFNNSHRIKEMEMKNRSSAKWNNPLDDVYNYDVLDYEIHLDVSDTEGEMIKGNTVMTAAVTTGSFAEVILDLHDDLAIDSLFLKEGNGSWYRVNTAEDLSRSAHRVYVALSSTLAEGEAFQIDTYYHGPAIYETNEFGYTNGLLFQDYSQGICIYTLSEPNESRFWFPCKNLPYDKSTSEMIITSLDSHTAVSNGKLLTETITGKGTKISHWQESYPISVYLISLCVSNYDKYANEYTALDGETTMPVEYYLFPDQAGVMEYLYGTTEVIKCYAEKFGEYPFLSEKYAQVSMSQGGGMEHQTCSTMGGYEESTIIHELAHQWFGDQLTCATWNDTWINEGGATYLEGIWYDYAYGGEAMENFMQSVLSYDMAPITDQSFALTLPVYHKGAWIYHMLRYLMGDELFFSCIKKLLNESPYSYGTLTSQQFIDYLQQESGVDLQKFYEQWIVKGGYPKYHFSYKVENDDTAQDNKLIVNVKQSQNISDQVPVFEMQIPVRVEFEDGTETTVILNNSSQEESFEFTFAKQISNNIQLSDFNYQNKILCTKAIAPYTDESTVFFESFEDNNDFPEEWAVYNQDGDSRGWINKYSSNAHFGSRYAEVSCNSDQASDDWLVTPKINIEQGKLEFYARTYLNSYPETFSVKLSTTGNQPADFTELLATETADTTNWTLYSYDLQAYRGEGVYIAFQYISEGKRRLRIDDIMVTNTSGVQETENIPDTSVLYQNYPNPFNPATTIKFYNGTVGDVQLKIYNGSGQEVATLIEGKIKEGIHKVDFDASGFTCGVYYYTLKTSTAKVSRRMLLLK